MKDIITAINKINPRSPELNHMLIIIAKKKIVPSEDKFSSIKGLNFALAIFCLIQTYIHPSIPAKEKINNGSVNTLIS